MMRVAALPLQSDRRAAWRIIAAVHGAYYLLTGLWPLAHLDSFQAVTGPKTDLWLVQTVGGLVCVPAVLLLWAALGGRLDRGTLVSGLGCALVLLAVDVIFVSRGRIAPVYLLDAAAEAILILAWLVCANGGRRMVQGETAAASAHSRPPADREPA